MCAVFSALALACAVSLYPSSAHGQTVLTLSEALNRARTEAPQVVAARSAIEEARAQALGASMRFQSNPEFDFNLGRRQGDGRGTTDLDVGVMQKFESPGRRNSRINAVTAQVEQAAASADTVLRDVLNEVAVTFYQAVHATERLQLLQRAEDVATAVFDTAERRFRAGDITVLEVNVARSALARTRADRAAAEADRATAEGALRVLLRIAGPVRVNGSFADLTPVESNSLTHTIDGRPEIRLLEAALREAEADAAFARTESRPDVGVGLRYQREESDQILLGGVTVSLPFFAKGQALTVRSAARKARLQLDLAATRHRLRTEVEAALAVYNHRLTAVQILERDGLPGLDENETLITRSFDVGQIGLSDVMLMRRESLETRLAHLSAQLEAALARVAFDTAAAVLR